MQLRPVQDEHPAPCTTGQSPSSDGHLCYTLGPGFTVVAVRDIHLQQPDPQQGTITPLLSVTLLPDDAKQFADLTERAYVEFEKISPGPSSQIAVVVDGQVIMAAQINNGPITGGSFEIHTDSEQMTPLVQLFHRLSDR
jgi:preprotein translocase subunit SecD